MILAHKIALDPTAEQSIRFAHAAGVARFAWNWGLAEYKAGEKPSSTRIKAQWNAVCRIEFPKLAKLRSVDRELNPCSLVRTN